jgi:hypothetical protein
VLPHRPAAVVGPRCSFLAQGTCLLSLQLSPATVLGLAIRVTGGSRAVTATLGAVTVPTARTMGTAGMGRAGHFGRWAWPSPEGCGPNAGRGIVAMGRMWPATIHLFFQIMNFHFQLKF